MWLGFTLHLPGKRRRSVIKQTSPWTGQPCYFPFFKKLDHSIKSERFRQIKPQFASGLVHFKPVDHTVHRCRKNGFVDEFIRSRIHGEGEPLFLCAELGIDHVGVAARIDPNPFVEAGEIDGVQAVQYRFVIDRRIKAQHLIAETGRDRRPAAKPPEGGF